MVHMTLKRFLVGVGVTLGVVLVVGIVIMVALPKKPTSSNNTVKDGGAAFSSQPVSIGDVKGNITDAVSYFRLQSFYGELQDLFMCATRSPWDCSDAGYTVCRDIIMNKAVYYNRRPTYFKFTKRADLAENVFEITEGVLGGWLNWVTGGNDCTSASISGCKNVVLLKSADQIASPVYWKVTPVTIGGDQYYTFQATNDTGVAQDLYLNWTSSGDDCTRDGAAYGVDSNSGCKNVTAIPNAAHSADPVYWKLLRVDHDA